MVGRDPKPTQVQKPRKKFPWGTVGSSAAIALLAPHLLPLVNDDGGTMLLVEAGAISGAALGICKKRTEAWIALSTIPVAFLGNDSEPFAWITLGTSAIVATTTSVGGFVKKNDRAPHMADGGGLDH